MKNIQVIDGAENCTFSIFQATEAEFALVFPADGQDIQFAEDLGQPAYEALEQVWERPVRKADAMGVHGTLFYQFERKRGYFPASKRERDWDSLSINNAQRRMYAQD